MAEIPVERKEGGGFPWWLIPLLLLLLLLPLLYFCSRNSAVVDNTNSNGNANRTVVTTGANGANGSTMSGTGAANMGANGSANAGGNMGGNTAVVVNSNTGSSSSSTGMGNGGNMNGATSGAVITDVNTFGTTTDKATLVGRNTNFSSVRVNRVLSDKVFTVKSGSGEFFVMLDENLDSGGAKEKQISIKPGQNVKLDGTYRNVPTGEVNQETKTGGLNKNEYAQMKGQNIYLHATSVSDVK